MRICCYSHGVFYDCMMKKLVFAILVILSIVFLVRIVRIFIYDYSRLTEYGLGYLIGSIGLFILFLVLSFWLGRKLMK
jgi:hypothetical protein